MHRITRLKYFGRTVRNVYKYLGSGSYWRNHLKTHGADVVTLRVWEFDDIEKCKAFALKFSADNNIIESKAWANQIAECGEHRSMPPGSYAGSRNPMFGRKHTDEVKEAQSRRLADTNSRSRWYTDGVSSRFAIEPPGLEWKPGRINHNNGRRWFNNGIEQTFAHTCPEGWVSGSLTKGKLGWFNNGIINKRFAKCPDGWKPGMFKTSVA